MGKDKKARAQNRITVMALANMIAALVDALREADISNEVAHNFLDHVDLMNSASLSGMPQGLLRDMIKVIRATVPSND
jgi:hypothetical protein